MKSNRGVIEPSGYVLNSRRATELKKLIAHRLRRRKKREVRVEKAATDRARDLGWLVRKMNGLGYAAWPDRLFIGPRRVKKEKRRFWVEFKKVGKDLTEAQRDIKFELEERRETVYVVWTLPEFDDILRDHDSRA